MPVIKEVSVKEGYEPLFEVLVEALNQAQDGKGHERHAQDLPFVDQPIVRLGMMYGPGGPGQQVGKKTQEAMRLPHDRGIAEMLGAINYAAAMVIVSRKLGYNKEAQLKEEHPVLTIKTPLSTEEMLEIAKKSNLGHVFLTEEARQEFLDDMKAKKAGL